MNNLAERVDLVIMDCLYKPEEVPDNKSPVDAVIVKGIVRTFAFHPARLTLNKANITEMISEMNSTFHKSGGGGWTFLNMCVDKNDQQWGEQSNCEALLCLAIGTEQGGYLLPREMWSSLPGSVPYIWLGE